MEWTHSVQLRQRAVEHMTTHLDRFEHFLVSESSVSGQGLQGREAADKYLSDMRKTGEWAGEPEMVALAELTVRNR